jgi:hypothetical protein
MIEASGRARRTLTPNTSAARAVSITTFEVGLGDEHVNRTGIARGRRLQHRAASVVHYSMFCAA